MNLTKHQMDALNHCLKCSICVDSCPVTKVDLRFPGPKQLGVDLLRIAQETGEQPSAAVDYCSNCKTCETVCPSGVHIATLNQLAKSKLPKSRLGLREMIFSDPSQLGKLIHIWPQAGNLATRLSPIKYLMEKVIGISAQASMPVYSTKSFSKFLRKYKPVYSQTPKKVLYFPGCFTQYNKPETGISLVRILAKLNYKVIVPDFKCCGQPSISNAYLKDTRKFADHNLIMIKEHLKKGMPMLFTCPSCLLTFKEEYQNILGMEGFLQYNVAMMDAGQFLLEHKEQIKMLLAHKEKPKLNLVYHEPCHLKASGQGTPGLAILNHIARLNINPLEAGCCGMSGSYGLKAEKQWIAQKIGNNVKGAITAYNAQAVVSECGMCTVQINYLTGLPVYHPLELLSEMIGQ